MGDLIKEYIELDEVDSTNRYALDTGRVGVLVTARIQSGGRGTRGRTWFSPAGTNLYMTITTGKPDGRFPLVTGVAVRDALAGLLQSAAVDIKWPNDMIISGKKVCGILCESRGDLTAIGIGINVNQACWPDELQGTAVSLAQVRGSEVDTAQVMNHVVICMDRWFSRFHQEGFSPVRERFLQCGLLKDYELKTEDGLPCSVVDIDNEGHLLVNVSGKLRTLVTGSIVIVR